MAMMRRRGLALVLALVLALSLLPANVLASEEEIMESVEAEVGDELTLDPGVDVEEVDGYWYSSDENVVLVDRYTGEIQVVGEGEAYVYFEYFEIEEQEEMIPLEEAIEIPEASETTDVEEGETEATDVEESETETTDVEESETETTDVEESETETTDVEESETETTDVEESETETTDVEKNESESVTIEAMNTSFSDGPETQVVTFKIIAKAPKSGNVEDYLIISSDDFGKGTFTNKALEIYVVDQAGNQIAYQKYDIDDAQEIVVNVVPQNGYQIVNSSPALSNGSVTIDYGADLGWGGEAVRTLTVTVAENTATEYEVTFIWNVNYLGGADLSDEVYQVVEVPAADARLGADMPTDPVYYSQKFEGWNTRADGKGDWVNDDTEITCDLTVYGQWSLSANASEYHVMGLDTDVAAYLREQLNLGQDDALNITRMDVRDTQGNTTEGYLGDLMNRPESHDGQRYWHIQNKTVGLGAVLPEAVSKLVIQVNGTTVEIPADAFTMTRVESTVLGTSKAIIEISLKEEVIPDPEPVTYTAEFYLLKEINRIPLENGNTQYAYGDYTETDLANMTGKVTGIAYVDVQGIIEEGQINGQDVADVFAGVNDKIKTAPSNDHLKTLKEQLLKAAGVEESTYDNYGIVWYVVKTTDNGTYHVDGAIYDKTSQYCTLTYDANTDDETAKVPSAAAVKVGESVDISFDASRDGYTFKGWATTSDGEPVYTSEGTKTIQMDSDKVLYAVWEKTEEQPGDVTITLSYDANAGGDTTVAGMPVADSKTVQEGQRASFTVSTQKPTREGYTFLGWAVAPTSGWSCKGGESVSLAEDMTLYAVWQKNGQEQPGDVTITLSYDANAGDDTVTGMPLAEEKTVKEGENATFTIAAAEPTRKGYTFLGWASSSSAATAEYEADDTISVGTDTILYAVWKDDTVIPPKETVTLSFQYVTDVHNASRVPSGVTEPEDQDVELGSTFGSHGYGTGSYSSRYTFHGWYADADCTDRMSSSDIIDDDMTVYGYWTVRDRDDDDDDDDNGGTNIPDENTPTTDLPDDGTPTTDIPDEGTPTTDLPDEDVPMAEAPKTGDNMTAWILAAGVSGLSLVWLAISNKKRSENEAK